MGTVNRDFIIARTGIQAYIEQFLKELPDDLHASILGASVFLPVSTQHMLTAANVQWHGSNREHRLFFEMYLLNRAFAFEGTSLQETVTKQTPLTPVRSGFKSNHMCLNIALASHPSLGVMPPLLQLVCLEKSPALSCLSDIQKPMQNFARFLGTDNRITAFERATQDTFRNVPLGPPREYFFMECDISGAAGIFDQAGWFNAKDFMAFFREQAASVAVDKYGLKQIASAGDGVRFALPCCRTDIDERCALLKDTVIKAAQEIAADYMQFKNNVSSKPVQESAIKIAISRGFDYRMPYDHDGESYYIMAGMKDASVPRDQAVILLDNQMNELGYDPALRAMLSNQLVGRKGFFNQLNIV